MILSKLEDMQSLYVHEQEEFTVSESPNYIPPQGRRHVFTIGGASQWRSLRTLPKAVNRGA